MVDQLTLARIYALAPDSTTLTTAYNHLPALRDLHVSADRHRLAGRCVVAGSQPYRPVADFVNPARTRFGSCTCPSSATPCQHVLAVLLAYVQTPERFIFAEASGPPPTVAPRLPSFVPWSPRAALLQTILDEPEADAPRLVYADWLDEHGESERATFIRLQCHAAHHPTTDTKQAEQLLLANYGRWVAELPGIVAQMHPEFARGFVETVTCSPGRWRQYGERIVASTPLRAARFRWPVRTALSELACCPALAHLRQVDLSGNTITGAALSHFLQSPFVQGIEQLDVSANPLGPLPPAFLDEVHLPALRHLIVARCDLSLHDVVRVVHSVALDALEVLDVRHNPFLIGPNWLDVPVQPRPHPLAVIGLPTPADVPLWHERLGPNIVRLEPERAL
jgi:uncharacterized protein (TIGR02996 family)